MNGQLATQTGANEAEALLGRPTIRYAYDAVFQLCAPLAFISILSYLEAKRSGVLDRTHAQCPMFLMFADMLAAPSFFSCAAKGLAPACSELLLADASFPTPVCRLLQSLQRKLQRTGPSCGAFACADEVLPLLLWIGHFS